MSQRTFTSGDPSARDASTAIDASPKGHSRDERPAQASQSSPQKAVDSLGGSSPLSHETLRMAYADPPYIGQSKKHYSDHPDYAGEVEHFALIGRLVAEYPDGWALSASSPSLQLVLSYCADWGLYALDGDIRVMAWVKPFAAFKRNVRVAYAWEPIIVRPARRLEDAIPTRDFIAEGITMKRGLTGVKPEKVCRWLFEAMGLRRCDQLDDLFPGSGAVARAWDSWTAQHTLEGVA